MPFLLPSLIPGIGTYHAERSGYLLSAPNSSERNLVVEIAALSTAALHCRACLERAGPDEPKSFCHPQCLRVAAIHRHRSARAPSSMVRFG